MSTGPHSLARRIAIFTYGVASYVLFLGVFLYAIGFLGNFAVPRSLDGAPEMPFVPALLVNLGLLAVFAVQHSVMARPAFKRWWTRFVPVEAERSTYVLFSNLAMILLFALWQPLGGTIWMVEAEAARAAIWGVYALGWLILLAATFMVDHFDLFGLRQIWFQLRGETYRAPAFKESWGYRFVRHPIYVGWITLAWATPDMSIAHLVFAFMVTAYILVAIQLEERDLVAEHGRAYADYRRRVPMLIPSLRPASRRVEAEAPAG